MHRTDEITLTLTSRSGKSKAYTIPAKLGRRVERMIREEAKPAFVPAAVALPELDVPADRVGAALRGSRHKAGMTQVELAALLGIRQSHLSEMEHGRRPVGREMARRLAAIFICDYRIFL